MIKQIQYLLARRRFKKWAKTVPYIVRFNSRNPLVGTKVKGVIMDMHPEFTPDEYIKATERIIKWNQD